MSSKHVPSEDSQLAILASDASLHDKAGACQRLVYVAGEKSVVPLAALLDDPVLSDYARSGLEAIDHPAASQALLDALSKRKGRLLAGVVNSLGVRREAKAVPALKELAGDFTSDEKSTIAAAAFAALGLIASPETVGPLKFLLANADEPHRTAVGHAALTAIERLQAGGQAEAASDLLESVRVAFPKGPVSEAARHL